MASINDVVARLSEIVASTGISVSGIVDMPNPPCCMVYLDPNGDVDYLGAFSRGVVTIPMVCHILVPSTELEGQTSVLYDLVSPFGARSIPAAIFEHPTLGTAANESTASSDAAMHATVPPGSLDFGFEDTPAGRVLQAKVRVSVMTRGDR